MRRAPIVLAAGHVIDGPDRSTPRFPPGEEQRVAHEIAAVFARWQVGPGWTLFTGGARGADILAAERALLLGATVELLLALPPDDFERRSVDLPGTNWVERHRALRERARVRHAEAELGALPGGQSPFPRTNEWLIEEARKRAAGSRFHALLVWNGQVGSAAGGTAHLASLLAALDFDGAGRPLRPDRADREVELAYVDPTHRAYEARQSRSGNKKMLALDGGGIRGVLTLEVLKEIEAQLRAEAGTEELVLSDYFDYIGGTSTGAIIAAGLALGRTVDDLLDMYVRLGAKIFKKRWLPLRIKSLYGSKAIARQLGELFGDRTLGDPGFKSLFLAVLHSARTDSFWPVSNCTTARYNVADRFHPERGDRNLEISLTSVVRGSTAAPVYFPPEAIAIGRRQEFYQDGGITPFNNPAFLMYMMATLPEYRLEWASGEDELLIVSVGTGFAANEHPDLEASAFNLLFSAKNLPNILMNGASIGQDMLCRVVGNCRYGSAIDREFGDRIGVTPPIGGHRFSYVRYNADLSPQGLTDLGLGGMEPKGLTKLDSVNRIADLRRVGAAVGSNEVSVSDHFRGFP